MVVFLVVVCCAATWLALFVAWVFDLWEREPLAIVERLLLLGIAAQVGLVILGKWAFGFEAWNQLGLLGAALPAGLLLPVATAGISELDEPYDGIVYGVALACGASLVLLLWDIPLLAREVGAQALQPSVFPGIRDLALALRVPAVLERLVDHVSIVAVAALTGSVYGTLASDRAKRWRMPALVAAAGTLSAALAAGDWVLGGAAWFRVLLTAAAVAAAAAAKRRSPFRAKPEPAAPDVTLERVKATLVVLGACLLALCVLASVADTDRYVVPAATQEAPR
jgi:hypothetical protein